MRKRYDVRGLMEWHPVFKVGRSRLQVSFTGGHMCGGAVSPATFETSNPVVQSIIEHSKEFKEGMITVGMIIEGSDGSETAAQVGSLRSASSCASGAAVNMTALHHDTPVSLDDTQDGNLIVMVVGSKAEAEDMLTVSKGVPAERLKDFSDCIAEARKIGIDLRFKQGQP